MIVRRACCKSIGQREAIGWRINSKFSKPQDVRERICFHVIDPPNASKLARSTVFGES